MLRSSQIEATTELRSIKLKGRSVTQASNRIYIGQDHIAGGGAVTEAREVRQPKLPPELLQKMREVLAIGVAKSIIAKSLAELQSEESGAIVAEDKNS